MNHSANQLPPPISKEGLVGQRLTRENGQLQLMQAAMQQLQTEKDLAELQGRAERALDRTWEEGGKRSLLLKDVKIEAARVYNLLEEANWTQAELVAWSSGSGLQSKTGQPTNDPTPCPGLEKYAVLPFTDGICMRSDAELCIQIEHRDGTRDYSSISPQESTRYYSLILKKLQTIQSLDDCEMLDPR